MGRLEMNLEIVYSDSKPYGIRDDDGFILFFADIHEFSGEHDRYGKEIEEQRKLANYLLSSLHLFYRTKKNGNELLIK